MKSKLNASRESLLAGAFETGIITERERWFLMLRDLGVLRDAMMMTGLVIYTENGPQDITREELIEKGNK